MNPIERSAAAGRRYVTRLRRRYSRLRHRVPPSAVHRYGQLRSVMTEYRRWYLPVKHRSPFANIYHCSEHKSGSQWLVSLLSDPVVFKYTGLSHFHYQSRTEMQDREPIKERVFTEAFPTGAIVSPLYVSFPAFQQLPKPDAYRAFFVLRDPRDLIVSWYFSTRDTHILDNHPDNPLIPARAALQSMTEQKGLRYAIDFWADRGRFEAMDSWLAAPAVDPNTKLVRFEDLVSDKSRAFFQDLFDFLEIPIPEDEFDQLLESYSFTKLSGRQPGETDERSHLRSGRAGDWERMLDNELLEYLAERSNDLAGRLEML